VSAPSSATAGVGFTVTMNGWDAWGNPANAFLFLNTSDNQAMWPNGVELSNGQATPTVTLDVAHTLRITASTDTNQPVWGMTNTITVKPGPVASLIVSAPSSVAVSTWFTATITAKDKYGNIATWDNGSVSLWSSDVNLNTYVPPMVSLSKGIGSASVRFDKVETVTLTASAGTIMGTSNSITVNAGPPAFFYVSTPPTVAVGTPFSVTVTAEDANYNIITSYNGTVTLTSSDSQAMGTSAFTSGWTAGLQSAGSVSVNLSGGTGSTTVLLETADTVALTATGPGSLTGTSSNITVTPDWFSSNVTDQRLQTLARWDDHRDGAITFADMEGLLNLAIYEAGNSSDANYWMTLTSDLTNIASNGSLVQPYVQNLTLKVVNPIGADVTNLQAMGLLGFEEQAPNATVWYSTLWQALENEWFLGEVHPRMIDGTAGNYSNVGEGLFDASNPSPFVGAPVFTDVFQGGVGDCTLMASLAEVAYRNPSIIQGMFIYDGTAQEGGQTVNVWTVRFYHNGQADYVTVDSELPDGGTDFAHPENNLWAALAEKAYAQINIEVWLNTIDGSLNDYSMAGRYSYAALNNGDAATMDQELGAITGLSSGHFNGFGGLGQAKASDIANHLENGEFVVMGTPNSVSGWALVHNHAYAVLSYDPNTDHFTLFNPWGLNNGKYNYSGVYYSAWDLFWGNSDFLNNNFSDGAQAGTAAIVPGKVTPPGSVESPTLPPPKSVFVSVPSPDGNGAAAGVGPSLPLASAPQRGQPTLAVLSADPVRPLDWDMSFTNLQILLQDSLSVGLESGV
jgi:hypothetical protein